jgi:hypothetical protein
VIEEILGEFLSNTATHGRVDPFREDGG